MSKYNKKTNLYKILGNFAFIHADFFINVSKPFIGLIINPVKTFFKKKLHQKGLIPMKIDIASKPFRNVKVLQPKEKIGRLALFLGCSSKHLYPQYITNLCSILTAINYEVVISPAEVCCGAPFRTLGLESQAIHCAKQNYETFKNLSVDAVLSLCPTCVDSLNNYPSLIGESIEDVYDANEFIFERFLRDDIIKRILPLKVVYHQPCHMVNKTPHNRKILKSIVSEVVMPVRRKCCGFGGTFSLLNPQLSSDILSDACIEFNKIEDVDAIVSACPGCVFQLSKQITDKPVYHIIELMNLACSFTNKGTALKLKL
jgi:glycolate oxidase iron-sulfur subunit